MSKELKTVKITKISRKERVSKRTGKPFTSLGILTEEYGERWLSGFDGKETERWVVGNTVDIEVEDTGEYLNFSVPRKDSSPAASNGATAELKNMLTFKIVPLVEEVLANQTRILANFDRLFVLLKAEKEDDYGMDGFNDSYLPEEK